MSLILGLNSRINVTVSIDGVVDIFNPEVTEGFCNYMKDLALADLFIANGVRPFFVCLDFNTSYAL